MVDMVDKMAVLSLSYQTVTQIVKKQTEADFVIIAIIPIDHVGCKKTDTDDQVPALIEFTVSPKEFR